MNSRAYMTVSGSVFGIVAVLHLLRVVNGWVVEVGPWSVPMTVSWLGTIFPAVLCGWAFRVVSRKGA
jgi:hypothetical protein